MKTVLAALTSLLVLTLAGAAGAQSAYLWEELGSGGGVTASYNPLSVHHEGDLVVFLQKVSFDPPNEEVHGQKVGAYTIKQTIDCAANTFQHADYLAYSPAGVAMPQLADPTPGANPILPGGLPALFKAKFCKG